MSDNAALVNAVDKLAEVVEALRQTLQERCLVCCEHGHREEYFGPNLGGTKHEGMPYCPIREPQ